MESGGILKRDALDEHILTVGEPHKVLSHLLLLFRGLGYIRITGLHVPWVPQLSVATLHASYLLKAFPFHVAHLTAFHGSPLCSVTIHNALSRDGNVLALRGLDAGIATARLAVLIHEEALVWREEHDGIACDMQVDIVFQLYRSCQPYTLWHHKPSPTLLGES